jgi:pimeloyl-ACP methyl ester carboxylesterase
VIPETFLLVDTSEFIDPDSATRHAKAVRWGGLSQLRAYPLDVSDYESNYGQAMYSLRVGAFIGLGAIFLGACGGPDPTATGPDISTVEISTTIVDAPTGPTATTATTATTAAPTTTPPSTTQPSDPDAWQSCTDCLEVTDISNPRPGRIEFTVLDRSGRNLTESSLVASRTKTLNPRPIYVVAFRPPGGGPWPTTVHGDYRRGSTPVTIAESGDRDASDRVEIWIGFAKMGSAPDFSDIANHPGDVSSVLDVLEQYPDLVPGALTDRVVYIGGSMGAISGTLFANSCCRDSRIVAALLSAGFPLGQSIGFDYPWQWERGPTILAANNHRDEVITYQFFRDFAPSQDSGRVTLMTVLTSNSPQAHATFDGSCPEATQFAFSWVRWQLKLEREPFAPPAACYSFGFVDGGSTGGGAVQNYFR